jgi:4-amino-4-deoxy-L-arabinose transferase-like glycosyltransferase
MEGHKGPFFYYIIAILIGFFPWSIFAAPALIGWRRRARGRRPWSAGYTLLATWTAAYVVLFSLVQTKLPSYVLPVYPALALATACFLHSWIEQTAEAAAWWMRYAFVLLATVGVALLIGLPIASRFIAQLDGELGLLGVIPLAAAAVCWRSSESGARERTVGAMALAAVLLAVCVFVAGVPRVDRHQTSEPLVDAIRRIGGPEAKIAAYRDLEPSFVFYAGRPIPIDYEPRQIEATLRDPNAYVILHPENLEAIQAHVPADVHVVARLPRFMKEGEIVVLGRDSRPGQSPRQAAIESANPPR